MSDGRLPRRERGMAVSVLVCLLIPVLLLCAGLAIDGAAKAAADRRAEAVAAQAARTGMDAAAPHVISGQDGSAAALAAAGAVLAAHPDIEGHVRILSPTMLEVSTTTSVETVFLGLAGIERLPASGSARVELRAL